jgi:hypothetical protein
VLPLIEIDNKEGSYDQRVDDVELDVKRYLSAVLGVVGSQDERDYQGHYLKN